MNIGDLSILNGTHGQADLNKMIEKLGKVETINRVGWFYGASFKKTEELIDQYLSGNYFDDKGTKGGDYFWGDL